MEKRTKLTKRVVDAAEPANKRYEIWDSELAGFGLRIEESGKKSFFVRYRVGGGRRATRRNMTIGNYGAVTPEKARGEAKKILGQAANGHDPADARNARRREMTLGELVDLYEQKGLCHPARRPAGSAHEADDEAPDAAAAAEPCGPATWPQEDKRRSAQGC